MTFYEGINPKSNTRGVIHLSEEQVPSGTHGQRKRLTLCGRKLSLYPIDAIADDDVPCEVCRSSAPHFWTPLPDRGSEQ